MKPAERISTAEFAAKYRRLSNTGGGMVGPWSNSIAPYVTGIQDSFDDANVSCVAIAGCGQSSKTELAVNYLMHTIVSDPCSMLWYCQTDAAKDSFVKDRINTLIDDHLELSSRLGRKPIDDSVSFKKFKGMSCQFLTATRSNLISKSAARIVADEIDAYPVELGEVKIQLDVRRQTFEPMSKLVLISHPDLATGVHPDGWQAGVMATYRDSTRFTWWWPCPECNQWSSPNPGTTWHMILQYPSLTDNDNPVTLDQVENEARLICPHCEAQIEDGQRRAMNAQGRWISSFCEVDKDTGMQIGETPIARNHGYWIVGTMSPFVFGGIGGLARSLAKAEHELEKTGDSSSLREVTVKMCGVPFDPRKAGGGSVDANTLAERASHNRYGKGIVQAGVAFITTAVDVQANRFEYLVRGWGKDSQSWVIDYDMIACDPARDANAWQKILELYNKTYPLNDGSGRKMKVRSLTFDSSGAPGVTQHSYTAWKQWKLHGIARKLGSNAGRDVWTLLPAKGVGTVNAPPLRVSYPEQQRKDRHARAGGVVPIMLFNANSYKDSLVGMLERESGAGSIQFPHWMRSKEPPHRLFEMITSSEIRQPTGKWERAVHGSRNEMLDLLVMSHACAHLNWLAMIDWSRPPRWAAPWDENSLIISETVPEGPVSKVKTTLQKLMDM